MAPVKWLITSPLYPEKWPHDLTLTIFNLRISAAAVAITLPGSAPTILQM